MRVTEAVALEPDRLAVTPPVASPRTFAWSASGRWAEVTVRVGVALTGTGLVWGAPHSIYGLLGGGERAGRTGLCMVVRPGRGTTWRIVASEQFIEAVGFGGTRVPLSWDGVGEIQQLVPRTARYECCASFPSTVSAKSSSTIASQSSSR
jgi:hypothetical protein